MEYGGKGERGGVVIQRTNDQPLRKKMEEKCRNFIFWAQDPAHIRAVVVVV